MKNPRDLYIAFLFRFFRKVRPYHSYREAYCREKRIKSVLEEADQRAALTNEERIAYANSEIEKMKTYPKEIIVPDDSLNATFPGASKPKSGRGSRARAADAGATAASQPQQTEKDASGEDADADLPLSKLSANATASKPEGTAPAQEFSTGGDAVDAGAPKGVSQMFWCTNSILIICSKIAASRTQETSSKARARDK